MLFQLQSEKNTPLNFSIDVYQASWVGSIICLGGMTGNLLFGFIMDYIGRKRSIYLLALPNMILWTLVYFANSIEFLFTARFFGGLTGGGIYIVLPIFIGEIADASIRGRLTSLFTLSLNSGILTGYIMSTYIAYHTIPFILITFPIIYIIFATLYPETPQFLLKTYKYEEARQSFMFYQKFGEASKEELVKLQLSFEKLKENVAQQTLNKENLKLEEFFTKRSINGIITGIVLMFVNTFGGAFALMNYMSNVFAAVKTSFDPNINTIIIGIVQVIGSYIASLLVDRNGRKFLLIISTSLMSFGLALFGFYAFLAEETDTDLSSFNWWLPLLLMAFIIFVCNVGITSVSFVVLVEVLPVNIRSRASSGCLICLSCFAFILLKYFPVSMSIFGLSATIWFCASVCAFGLFYISTFLKETKGISLTDT